MGEPTSVLRRPLLPVILLFAGLTILFQPGLVRHLTHAFPLSPYGHIGVRTNETVPRDTLLHMGILAHDVHALTHKPGELFQFPVFHPHRDVLAYTDHLLAQAIVSLPLWLFTDSIPLVHNLLLLASFVACGVGGWLLARHLSGSQTAGIIAGILLAFWSQRAHDMDQIQMLWCFWMPFALYALHRWSETGRTRFAVAFALLAAGQGLSGMYLGLYFLTLAVPFGVWLLWRSGRLQARRTWAQAALGAALGGALLVPAALPYLAVQRTMGFTRSIEEAAFFSQGLGLYLKPYPGTWLHRLLGSWLSPEGTGQFLGVVPVVLIVLAFAAARRRSAAREPTDHRLGSRAVVLAYSIWTAAAILLSGGPRLRLGGSMLDPSIPGPFALLFRWVPGFDGTRAPARFSYVAVLGMTVLAGLGAAWLLRRLPVGRMRTAVAIALAAACFLEPRADPPDLYRDLVPRGIPAEYAWLAAQPPGTAVFEMPANVFFDDAIYVYMAGYHHRPIVNGTSGYIPQASLYLRERMNRFPALSAIRLLQEVGVRAVIQHDPSWNPPERRADRLPQPVFEEDGVRVFPVPPAGPDRERAPWDPRPIAGATARSNLQGSHPSRALDGDPATAWRVGLGTRRHEAPWLLVDLGREENLSGLRLQPGAESHSSWSIRVETSVDGEAFEPAARELQPESLRTFIDRPEAARFEARFPPRPARYVRLTNPGFWADTWSVAELTLERSGS